MLESKPQRRDMATELLLTFIILRIVSFKLGLSASEERPEQLSDR
jgi:hypothetical protein